MDFNDVEYSMNSVIPKGTIVKVCMTIKKGHCNDELNVGNTQSYGTRSSISDAVYLDCEFTVVEGQYKGCKFFDLIGLYSPKGSKWAEMGRSTIKGILSSARRVKPNDKSPQAQQAFSIDGYGDLDGITFLTSVKVEESESGDPRNKLLKPVTPNHKDYEVLMGSTHNAYGNASQPQYQPQTYPQQQYQPQHQPQPPADVLDDSIPF
ncbi:MAG: hypothetical protein C6D10_04100 [Candidatus Liberibacter solanacearum]